MFFKFRKFILIVLMPAFCLMGCNSTLEERDPNDIINSYISSCLVLSSKDSGQESNEALYNLIMYNYFGFLTTTQVNGIEQQYGVKLPVNQYFKDVDVTKAITMLNIGIIRNIPECILLYSYLFSENLDLSGNAASLTQELKNQAVQDHALAKSVLGLAYLYPTSGLASSHKTAYELLQATSEQIPSKFGLGRMYIEGIQVKADFELGLSLLKEAAAQDYVPAIHYLGHLYADGKYTKQDKLKALDYFVRATDIVPNDVNAACAICDIMLDLDDPDIKAKYGDKIMSILLGYENSSLKNPNDLTIKSFVYLAKLADDMGPRAYHDKVYYLSVAAKLGDKQSQAFMSEFRANLQTAKQQAIQGDVHAIRQLMCYYYRYFEEDLQPDYAKAFTYAKQLESHNDPLAFRQLALMYANGDFVPKDLDLAWKYLKKAFDAQDSETLKLFNDLELDPNYQPQNLEKILTSKSITSKFTPAVSL